MFGFEPRELHVGRCEEVEIVLENTDEIRHDLMIPGLNPIFAINVVGPDTISARFVTPDEDVTLFMHCHVPAHDKVGMVGRLVVGRAASRTRCAQAATPAGAGAYRASASVIAAVPREGRLIVNHEAITGFMAAMEMSYPVAPPSLLTASTPATRSSSRSTPAKSAIVAIEVIEQAK